jgi:hypothetical protein
MKDNGFAAGHITYSIETIDPAKLATDLAAASWIDGYVTFSASEKRLKDAALALAATQLGGRVSGIPDAVGYVMEINLWRREGSLLFEISAERQNDRFFVQTWQLDTAPASGKANCWHREAETRSGSYHQKNKYLFSGVLKSQEVVWPEYRLNFYITSGGE